MVAGGDFEYRGDHVVCPQGKILKRAAYHRRNASYQNVASQKDADLPHQGAVSSAASETPVPGTNNLLSAVP